MKEIINIIKEIKNMENAQQEENSEVNLGYTIDRRNSNNEKKYARTSQSTNKTYSNDAEGELLQQLDETKDIYEREKIIAKLKAMQKSKTPQKENLLQELYKKLEILLVPKDENDGKNVIMEIRGAAGGDEANIFAGDLDRKSVV